MKLSRQASIVALLAAALFAASCANTIRGVGRDASNTVNAAEDAVQDVAD